MDANFSFSIDRARDLVRIKMAGLFGLQDIAAFLEARRRAHAGLDCGANEHADPAWRSRRLAFVASQTLARSQLMRALDGRDARCFDDPDEAEAWLFAEEVEAPLLRRYASR